MRIAPLLAGCHLLLVGACAHAQTPPSSVDILERAASLPPGQTEVLKDWLAANPAPGELRAAVLGELCDGESRAGRYASAAEACAAKAELLGDRTTRGLTQSILFWRSLASVPPLQVTGGFDEPLSYGWAGIGEVTVRTGATSAGWGVDTGAEVSVLRASDAGRFGVRMIEGDVGVSGSTAGVAVGALGVIDSMHIGGAEIRNVPVLVLPDENLTIEGQPLPPILGMPALYPFGTLAFVDHGARLRGGSPVDVGAGRPITWNISGFAIGLRLAGGDLRVHLDTGANRTSLGRAAFELLSPTERASLSQRTVRFAGVSGAEDRQVADLARLDVGVADAVCSMQTVAVGDEDAGAQGRAGMDLIRACETVVLDFSTMTFRAR
ncbi:MAG: aspartyl protease family protein [Alphaproteobacteria bacterium]|jgi:hypothetical protein|nr:aspartyl protease family protein [Alphaproteobacteria bacterium]MBU2041168.1 aspartyl protease family protein [Alphaproteobacteria bacterium]MBU2125527.1 aspartyl protease family protein [Alphaproteobacteria bacterium]MBU2208514.1 aspartyl protease family protein [Alphaproteobacteria bacterium]MBU2289921.1 aspartyl protease family protein [Alphaproteobacteria bacterium]